MSITSKKLIVVGDTCGKTSLLMVFRTGNFPEVINTFKNYIFIYLFIYLFINIFFGIYFYFNNFNTIN